MTDYSHELSREEIETSIDLSDKLQAVIDYINSMQYPSQIRKFWPTLPRVSIRNNFNEDEVDAIAGALRRREFELSAKSIGNSAVDWSPSANMPPTRERDWMERAANDLQDLDE